MNTINEAKYTSPEMNTIDIMVNSVICESPEEGGRSEGYVPGGEA